MAEDDHNVRQNPDERRYELWLGSERAGELVYRDRGGNVLAFLHTEIYPGFEGRGLGGALVAGALDDARRHGFGVVPLCPFVDAYIKRHPGYADLVVADPSRQA